MIVISGTLRNKIMESSANVFYLQETKKENFDLQFSLVSLLLSVLIKFDFCPSEGAFGGSWFVDGLLHTLMLLLLSLDPCCSVWPLQTTCQR